MALKFFTWFKRYAGAPKGVSCKELLDIGTELSLQELAFMTCVNLVASAIGKCEVRTYIKNEERLEAEYYLWNIEPNTNQNSSAFWHKVVYQLFTQNEALIVNSRKRNGGDSLVCADSFVIGNQYPSKQNEYTGVTVDDFTYDKTFYEKDVLHLKLNHMNVKPLIDGFVRMYVKLTELMNDTLAWDNGRHWKVHVSQMARGGDDWAKNFQAMINDQFKPFLTNSGSVLPEFDGYDYKKVETDDSKKNTESLLKMTESIFNETAKALLIPVVLIHGQVEATSDANMRFLTNVIDPLCDQIAEEINRKRYGYEEWKRGNYVRMDSSAIIHFDLLSAAANIEKLVGSACYTINEIRRSLGQSTINEPWADQHWMTLNISSVENQAKALGTGKE